MLFNGPDGFIQSHCCESVSLIRVRTKQFHMYDLGWQHLVGVGVLIPTLSTAKMR